LDVKQYQGKTWLTRPRPEIDRVGSAWLISKFIDRKPKFVFASSADAFPNAIPFDMLDVEFSHHGNYCTFETLTKSVCDLGQISGQDRRDDPRRRLGRRAISARRSHRELIACLKVGERRLI
jgi:hypothetical protein